MRPVTIPEQTVRDHPCERCGHPMKIRRSWDGSWFYGCAQWPGCGFTYDADQVTGAPILHLRRGVPFRDEVRDTAALFAALKRNIFNLEAGEALAQASKDAQAARQKSGQEHERVQLKQRIAKAAPKTLAQWIEFIRKERQLAVKEALTAQYFVRGAARSNR